MISNTAGLPASMSHPLLHEKCQSKGVPSIFSWRKAIALLPRPVNSPENQRHSAHWSSSLSGGLHESGARNNLTLIHLWRCNKAPPRRGCTHQLLLTWRETQRLRSWKRKPFFDIASRFPDILMHHAFGKHMRNIDHVQSLYEHIDDVFSFYDTRTSYGPTVLPKKLEPRFEGHQIDRSRRLEMEILMLLFAWLFDSRLKSHTTLPEARVFLMVQILAYFCVCSSNWTSLDVESHPTSSTCPHERDRFARLCNWGLDHSQQLIELPEKSRMQRLSYIPSSQKVLYDFEECEIEHDLRQVVDSHGGTRLTFFSFKILYRRSLTWWIPYQKLTCSWASQHLPRLKIFHLLENMEKDGKRESRNISSFTN